MTLDLREEFLKIIVFFLCIIVFIIGFYIGNVSNDNRQYLEAYIQCTSQKQQLIDAIEMQTRLTIIEKENEELKLIIKDFVEFGDENE